MNIIKDNSANQKTDKHNEPTINKNDITQESNKAPQKHDIIGIKQHIINTNDYKKKRELFSNKDECKQILQRFEH